MAIHDWNRVPAELFHDFHQDWSIEIRSALNRGLLPRGFSAMVEQRAGPKEADVLAVESGRGNVAEGGLLIRERPIAPIVRRSTSQRFADLANRVVVRHHLGRIVTVIEIVSPGNKDRRTSLRDFVEKSVAFLHQGIHLLIVDLFPPTPRDPHGIHEVIWNRP